MNEKKELKKLFVFDWKILAAIIFLMIDHTLFIKLY